MWSMSGVPAIGAPDFIETVASHWPNTAGDPGRTIWLNATPASASALICTTEPIVDAGVEAPPSTNGENSIAWFAAL